MKTTELSNVIELDLGRAPEPDSRDSYRAPPSFPSPLKRSRPGRIIAVGGGKGGVGKTLVAANLGIALARQGRKVMLVDADLGGSSLHTALGIPQPARTLSDFVNRRVSKIEDVALPTGIENVSLVAGSQDVLDAANPKYQQKVKLLRSLQGLDVDYLLLDLGAGTSFSVLDFFLIANHGILVLLPEPTSVENGYRFVKSAFFRRLQYLEEQHGMEGLVEDSLSSREGIFRTPFELVARMKRDNPELADALEKELHQFRVKLVVNQARTGADLLVGNGVVSAWKKFFGLDMDFLGAIRYDDDAWRAIRRRRPVVIEHPECQAAQGLLSIANQLLSVDARSP